MDRYEDRRAEERMDRRAWKAAYAKARKLAKKGRGAAGELAAAGSCLAAREYAAQVDRITHSDWGRVTRSHEYRPPIAFSLRGIA